MNDAAKAHAGQTGPQTPPRSAHNLDKARYLMIGGFLGAGKTTAISKIARILAQRGLRVGLITNDQGAELVDTRMLRSHGFPTEEISGGCFCCRFNSLVEAARRLSADSRPDVFVAEPVGSCTDLIATVSYPLRRIYGDQFEIAPLSVLVDPVRAERVLGLADSGRTFSEKVLYIYRKQLEEADLIVIAKSDLLESPRHERLSSALAARFPQAEILAVSARAEQNLVAWLDRIMNGKNRAGTALEIDYDTYAEGEALLGWLNATLRVRAPQPLASDAFLETFALEIQSRLNALQAEIAHLKMTLSPENSLGGQIAVLNLVRNDFVPEVSQHLEEPFAEAELVVNLRAELDPESLESILREAAAQLTAKPPRPQLSLEHIERFRPGRPIPTHRDRGTS